jgi:Flp pilus assembly protein TadD
MERRSAAALRRRRRATIARDDGPVCHAHAVSRAGRWREERLRRAEDEAHRFSEAGQRKLEAVLRETHASFPDDQHIALWLAHTIQDTDRLAALALVERVAASHADEPFWLIKAAGLMVNFDHDERARPWIERAKTLSVDPDDWATLELLDGCILDHDGVVEGAERAMRRAFTADPELDYGFTLSRLLAREGRFDDARDLISQGIDRTPRPPFDGRLHELRRWIDDAEAQA